MEEREIQKILKTSKVVAVVGLSPDSKRPSHRVASFLKDKGYRIIPIRPKLEEVLGEKAYPSLLEIPPGVEIDVVDIFRRPEEVLPIVKDAIRRGVRVIWMQEGIVNEEAARIAREASIRVIMDRCMLKDYNKLIEGV